MDTRNENLYRRNTFIFSKDKTIATNNDVDTTNFFNLNICTFNTRLSQSVNYKNKIDELIDFIEKSDLDIICLQGIRDIKILKIIAKKLFVFNKESKGTSFSIFPVIDSFYFQHNDQIDHNSDDIIKITWSNSNDVSLCNIDCLIISKYDIISGTKSEIRGYEKEKYAFVANINVRGILVSIYNVSLTGDFIGTTNGPVRKHQIRQLKLIVSANSDKLKTDNCYSEYDKKNIHIISCLGCIQELFNGEINDEYLLFTRTLKVIDIYRYIQSLKNVVANNMNDSTNIEGYRSNYMLLYCEDLQTPNQISEKIYNDHKIVIINSIITKLLKSYEDYPVITTFLVEKSMLNISRRTESIISSVLKLVTTSQ